MGEVIESYNLPEATGKVLRRSLYLEQRRDNLPPMQTLFDGPTSNESCSRRNVTTVALQPLFMLNSEFMLARARALAGRVTWHAGLDQRNQINTAFLMVLGRHSTNEEFRAVEELFRAASANPGSSGGLTPIVSLCHLLLNLNEFIYLE